MTNSSNKGASFERRVAADLYRELGIKFERDLDQYRKRDRGDLLADHPNFPFLIECKAHASGTDCRTAWVDQAVKAAENTGQIPVVAYKFDRHPVKFRVPIEAIVAAHGGSATTDKWADISLEGFAYLVRETLAGQVT